MIVLLTSRISFFGNSITLSAVVCPTTVDWLMTSARKKKLKLTINPIITIHCASSFNRAIGVPPRAQHAVPPALLYHSLKDLVILWRRQLSPISLPSLGVQSL